MTDLREQKLVVTALAVLGALGAWAGAYQDCQDYRGYQQFASCSEYASWKAPSPLAVLGIGIVVNVIFMGFRMAGNAESGQARQRVKENQEADRKRFQESIDDEQEWLRNVGARKRAEFKEQQASEYEEFERKLGREYERDYERRLALHAQKSPPPASDETNDGL